jgi:hypothetical protein
MSGTGHPWPERFLSGILPGSSARTHRGTDIDPLASSRPMPMPLAGACAILATAGGPIPSADSLSLARQFPASMREIAGWPRAIGGFRLAGILARQKPILPAVADLGGRVAGVEIRKPYTARRRNSSRVRNHALKRCLQNVRHLAARRLRGFAQVFRWLTLVWHPTQEVSRWFKLQKDLNQRSRPPLTQAAGWLAG